MRCDGCCVQEHWLRSDQFANLNSISKEFDAYAVSAMPQDTASSFHGRPYGGLVVLVNRSLFKVTNLGYSLDTSFQALHLTTSGSSILLFNVYFSCLSSSDDYLVSLNMICGFILQIIEQYACSNYQIVICSDSNASWNNIEWDVRLKSFKDIVSLHELYPMSELYAGDVKYTYSCPARNVFSWLDNIFV